MTHRQLVQRGWITAKDFTEMYSLSKDVVYINKRVTDTEHIKKFNNSVYVNHKALLKRREFYHRVWLEATDNYYLLTDGGSQFKLAKVLSKYLGGTQQNWTVWMDTTLFSTAFMDRSLLEYKVLEKLWNFWRFTKWMIRIIKRKNLHHRK